MAIEIERKFLVRSDQWREGTVGCPMVQGYLARQGVTVRVRQAGKEAVLTLKGPAIGIRRAEFEYPIPLADARELLALCPGPLIEKTRFLVKHEGHCWEVDEFHGANTGLVLAEIELVSENETFARPSWVGKEVSTDFRYFNANLSRNPFREWKSDSGTAES